MPLGAITDIIRIIKENVWLLKYAKVGESLAQKRRFLLGRLKEQADTTSRSGSAEALPACGGWTAVLPYVYLAPHLVVLDT